MIGLDFMSLDNIKNQLESALNDLLSYTKLDKNNLLVVGASTSEVLGKHIGSAGSEKVAKIIFDTLMGFKNKYEFNLAFQSCEHINRAVVIEREIADRLNLEIVTVIPVNNAGGATATYAYNNSYDPVVVEFIKADAGIDIGDTFIGMHLKHVAIPVRSKIKKIGEANITMARTRPKLIGGERAKY